MTFHLWLYQIYIYIYTQMTEYVIEASLTLSEPTLVDQQYNIYINIL